MESEVKLTAGLSNARRALLQRYLEGAERQATSLVAIPKRSGSAPAPLSYSQQQIWLHSQLAPEAGIYNEPITIHHHGQLNPLALERSFTEIVRRHEAWRTTFEWSGDQGVQIVQPAPDHIPIPYLDLRNLAEIDRDREALRRAREDLKRPFDLGRGPLYRMQLIRLTDLDHRLFLTLHHLIFDGVSLYRILLPELQAFYDGIVRGEPVQLPPLPIQYSDYAVWQRDSITEIAPEHFDYWQRVCRDIPVLDLPTDHPRPALPTYSGATEFLQVPSATTSALKRLSDEENATPFMTMVAAFMALLHGYTRQEEIVIGGVTSGRRHVETMGLLGCFLNTLPIRCALSDHLSFTDLLATVRKTTLEALSHDEVPFELLVQRFAPSRDARRMPLLQALIVVEPALDRLKEEWGFSYLDVDPGTAKFDLELGLDDRRGGLTGRFIYNTDIFEKETIVRLKARWLALLDSIAANPQQTLSLLSNNFSPESNETPRTHVSTSYPRDATVHDLFERRVRLQPSTVALSAGGVQLTYDQLNRQANRLAHRLRKLGVRRDLPVGVWMERSPEAIVALLAILKAGGAYVPLDPGYPVERLAFMMEDTEAPVILTQSDIAHRATGLVQTEENKRKFICLDAGILGNEPDENLPHRTQANDLAYVIYTSGSTGRPKGVAIPHRGVVRLVTNTNYTRFSPEETFLQLAPLSFDASTFEIWGALLNGGRLALLPSPSPSLEEIGSAIRGYGVTTLWLTAGLFNAMVDERLADLRPVRQLLAGGDVLSVAHVARAIRALPDTCLVNGYGPTESTTFACCHTITPADAQGRAIPIGRPIANTTAYILDSMLNPVPDDTEGELFLGGDGLARGYWRNPALTAEKFVANPFSDEPGARLYRTGDRARRRPDGVIEFLGRLDSQIKLRGFRIEPGEIEAAMRRQPGVLDCVVIAREDVPGEKRLVGYVVRDSVETATVGQSELIELLGKSLPNYMLPSAIVFVSSLPRTANGKVDRNALPPPEETIAQSVADLVVPRTPLEAELAVAWETVLGLKNIGITDNFFTLGGHSLSGLRLVNRISEKVGFPVPLTIVFEAPTIAEMAERLETKYRVQDRSDSSKSRPFGSIAPVNRESRRAHRS